jgi:hypothetical protein
MDSGLPKGVRRESLLELIESFNGRMESQGGSGWEIRLPRVATPWLYNAVLSTGAMTVFAGGG